MAYEDELNDEELASEMQFFEENTLAARIIVNAGAAKRRADEVAKVYEALCGSGHSRFSR